MTAIDEAKAESSDDNNQIMHFSKKKERMFVPSLAVIGFGVSIPALMLTLVTVNIAATFNVPAGVAAQLNTVSSMVQFVFALLMGVFAVRFKHKSLLLIGSLLVIVSCIISFFAPTFALMQLVFALIGGGAVMVNIMAMTLIGECLPAQKKAKAISYFFVVASFASLVGNPVIGFLTDATGWRSVFLLFVLPVSVAGLILVYFVIPSRTVAQNGQKSETSYGKSFRHIFSSKSAVSCLVGGIVIFAGTGSFGLFAIAYYREHFLVSMDFTVGVMLGVSLLFIVAAVTVGRLINRVGARKIVVGGLLVSGILMAAFFLAPNLWVALALNFLSAWFFAVAATAFSCLIIDQVPQARGTMLSLNTVCMSIGTAIGTATGGTLLVLISYQAVGFAFTAFCIFGTIIFYCFAKEPKVK